MMWIFISTYLYLGRLFVIALHVVQVLFYGEDAGPLDCSEVVVVVVVAPPIRSKRRLPPYHALNPHTRDELFGNS